jgi:hypothetical protein
MLQGYTKLNLMRVQLTIVILFNSSSGGFLQNAMNYWNSKRQRLTTALSYTNTKII